MMKHRNPCSDYEEGWCRLECGIPCEREICVHLEDEVFWCFGKMDLLVTEDCSRCEDASDCWKRTFGDYLNDMEA